MTDTSTSRAAAATAASGEALAHLRVEGIGTGTAIDGIQRVMYGDVHHRVHTRFGEPVAGGKTRRDGGPARSHIPVGDRIRLCGLRHERPQAAKRQS